MPNLPNRMQNRSVVKYLTQYNEQESMQLNGFPGEFNQGLVIPIYREEYNVLLRFQKFASFHPKTLLIFVINRPDHDLDTQWAQPFLTNLSEVLWQSECKCLTLQAISNTVSNNTPNTTSECGMLIVDRCINGNPIPEKQGVGLARKIGADILCSLINQKKVCSPWIFNTDADAHLPDDYFSIATQNTPATSAFIYPFEHFFDNTNIEHLPTLLYEFSLHYYVEGLKKAGSPYAYHTLGSTIAIHYSHYAKVRGFPKRAAAEDFYLLNKLAKTGKITTLTTPMIQLTARESTRVPFGTGPAVINIGADTKPLSMPIYHPSSFGYLHIFMSLIDTLCEKESVTNPLNCIHTIIEKSPGSALQAEPLIRYMNDIKFSTLLEHSFQHGKNKSARLQHMHHWFDGFRTLKFIHYLRDNYLGTISFQQWLSDYYLLTKKAKNVPLTTMVHRIKLNI